MKRAGLFVPAVLLFLTIFTAACLRPGGAVSPQPGGPAQPAVPAPTAKPVEQTPQPAAKQLTILASSAQPEFPAQLIFSLKAGSSVNITDIRMHYAIVKESFASVTSEVFIEFTPSPGVSVQWPWDMKKTGGIPTGATVRYWWTVKDSNGDKIETAPATINFDDNRHTWQSLTQNNVTIYWYSGGKSFAGELMATAQQAMTRLALNTGATLKRPVRIYIYASTQDLQGAMIFPQEWTGGAAFPEYGIITIGIDPNNLTWGKGAITHELTHLVIHQVTFNPYIDLPTWLDEGLAMYNEGPLEAGYADFLKAAIDNNRLISVRSLSSPFSAFPDQSYLSYAQSYSFIDFLVTGYGESKMLELLNTFSQGSSYDGALEKVYGFDMDGMNSAWRDFASKQYQKAKGPTVPQPPSTGSAFGMLPGLMAANPGTAGRLGQ